MERGVRVCRKVSELHRRAELLWEFIQDLPFKSRYLRVYLKTLALNKGEKSVPFLGPPTASNAGISDDGLLVEARVEVKDHVWALHEVHVEPGSREGDKINIRYNTESFALALNRGFDINGQSLERPSEAGLTRPEKVSKLPQIFRAPEKWPKRLLSPKQQRQQQQCKPHN